MGTSRNIPAQLYTSVPAPKKLLSFFTIQIPEHSPIQVTTVDLDSLKDLSRISKLKFLSDSCAILNESPSLAITVIVHITVPMKFMAKVCGFIYPGDVHAVELEGCWLGNMS